MSSVIDDADAAAQWIATALQKSGYDADFSLRSLAEIDRFFDDHSANGQPKPNGLLAKDLGHRLFAVGAYIGEVLRRESGGSWIGDDNDPKAELNIIVRTPTGLEARPVQRAMKRLRNGREDSIAPYGQAFLEQAGFATAKTAILERAGVTTAKTAMVVHSERLRSITRKYLESPASKHVWEKLTNSVLMNVVGSLFMLPIALILVCTIIFAKIGLLMIWGLLKSFFTLEVFRDQRKVLLNNPDEIQPIITAGIIIGPHGHGLVVGEFSNTGDRDLTTIGRIANELAELYATGDTNGRNKAIVTLLRDDRYRGGRRRMVPKSHSQGRDLILFDMEINKAGSHFADGVVWVACMATVTEPFEHGEPPRGDIVQIPWSVVAPAVRDARVDACPAPLLKERRGHYDLLLVDP